MTNKQLQSLIKTVEANEELLEEFAKWMVENKHSTKYRECEMSVSPTCAAIGLASSFHGSQCRECRLQVMRGDNARRAEKKRLAKENEKV